MILSFVFLDHLGDPGHLDHHSWRDADDRRWRAGVIRSSKERLEGVELIIGRAAFGRLGNNVVNGGFLVDVEHACCGRRCD